MKVVTTVNPVIFLVAVAFSMLTVFASCRKPAALAAKVSPMEALHYVEQSGSKKKQRRSKHINATMMAKNNLGRNKKKVVIVALSFALSIVLLNSVYTYVTSFDFDKFVADFSLTDFTVSDTTVINSYSPYNTANVSADFVSQAESLEGLEQIGNIYLSTTKQPLTESNFAKLQELAETSAEISNELGNYMVRKEHGVNIYGLDDFPAESLQIIEGALDEEQWKTGNGIYVTPMRMMGNGSLCLYHPGDQLSVAQLDGTMKTYTVLAVVDLPKALETPLSVDMGVDYIFPSNELLGNMIAADQPAMKTIFNVDDEHLLAAENWLKNYTANTDTSLDYFSKVVLRQSFDVMINMYEKIDDGYSGIIFDRPAFKEMMQDITDGNINCVIVKDLSRLGREYIETGRYLRRVFPAYGVRFIAITDNIDTAHDSSGDDLTVSVKNIMNEAYCRDISIKTRTSLDVKRRNGDFVGAFTVYGYMKSEDNKNQLVPDPYASRVVRDIFRMRLEGASASKIAAELNRLGILSPLAYKKNNGLPYAKKGYADKADCKWSATTIIRILQDETYTGTLVQGKQGTPHYKIKQMEQRPASEWVRVTEAHEPLIARQDFELVQRIKGLDTRTSPKEDTVYLFSGILICGCCGSRMTRKTNRAGGKEYHYYYCPTGKKKGCTHPVMLKESSLIACVRDSLKAYIDNVASLETLLSDIDQASINQALAKEYSDHITDNERRLEQVLEFKARLYESLVGGMLTKEEYASYKAKYSRQAEDIKESIRVLKDKLTDVMENRSERNRWISQFTQFSTLETLDRRALIHMVQSIRVMGKKELAIAFTYEDEYKKALQLIKLAAQSQQTEEFEHRKVG